MGGLFFPYDIIIFCTILFFFWGGSGWFYVYCCLQMGLTFFSALRADNRLGNPPQGSQEPLVTKYRV